MTANVETTAVMGYDWPVVTPRRVLGRRDTPTIQFFALWIGSLAASVLLGLASIEFDWSGIPIKAFGLETFVTIYPPLIFCTLLTIWFGFLWGFVPAYLATLLLALRSGMPFEWSVLFAFADPLGLLILWFGFRFARIDPSLRGWRPCVLFALLCFFGALLGSSGSFIWTFTNRMGVQDTVAIWQGWWIGAFFQTLLINGPLLAALSPGIRRWLLRTGLGSEVLPRGKRQFFLHACLIVVLASAFIVFSSRMVLGGLNELMAGADVPDSELLRDGLLAVESILWVAFGVILAITTLGLIILMDWISSLEARVSLESMAKAEANQSADEKARFLSTMSHEIRTPMNGVIGMTDLLRNTPLNPEQRALVNTLGVSGKNLLRLINDSLDLSRLQSGELVLERIEFDLRECIEEGLEIVSPAGQEKGIELLLDMAPDLPTRIVGDPGRLTQVVLNLVGNAIKFSDDREVVVRTGLKTREENAAVLEIMVEDHGVGISPEEIERMFEPYQQAAASTAREFGGSGLGLSICRQLSEMMGGAMRCESEPGRGSRFWFEFRAEIAAGGDAAPARAVDGRPLWLWLANPEAARCIGATLERSGVAVERVATAAELEPALRDGAKPGCIVCDIELLEGPEGPGLHEFVSRCEHLGRRFAIRCDLATSLRIGTLLGSHGEILHKPERLEALRALAAAPTGRGSEAIAAAVPAVVPVTGLGRVLVADDNPVNIEVVEMMLGRLGISCDSVGNGKEALEALENGRYGVVLLDVQMPIMDGLQAAREIVRRYPEATRPRLAAMTANAEKECRQDCLEAGFTCFLGKPFVMEQLRALLVGEPGGAASPEAVPTA